MSSQETTYNGADLLVNLLVQRDVTTIFSITGAGNLAIIDAIARDARIRVIYCHHEQAVVMAAQGYARVTGEVAVALVTTGGGVSNALTGVISAQLDSVPILLISGNESSFHCIEMADFRAFGVQGFDSISVYAPVTKFAKRILDQSEIAETLTAAWDSARQDRCGVAFIDFPMDLQRTLVRSPKSDASPMTHKDKPLHSSQLSDQIRTCALSLSRSESPLIYLGNGVRSSENLHEAITLVELHQIPFVLSWSAIDLVEDSHPLNMGRVGIYGDRAANILLQKADLLLCVGTRLAIPQVGYDKADFARNAERWVIDIEPTELSKFPAPNWHTITLDSGEFLKELKTLMPTQKQSEQQSERDTWLKECRRVWHQLPREKQYGSVDKTSTNTVHSSSVIECLNKIAPDNAVFVTDVGAGLLSGHYSLRPKSGWRVMTSQGLGEMGFGLPAAIGAHMADSTRPIICLNTDGGLMFNIQELQTVRALQMPLKLFVFNNEGYGMIRISQENLFGGRFAGINPQSGVSFPNFADVASTFGMKHIMIQSERTLEPDLTAAMQVPGPILIEILMSPEQKYEPRLKTQKLSDGTLSSPPLDDLDPFLTLDDLEDLLGTKAHKNSYLSRGISYE